ncbi:MAG: PKD domain-containing protein [Nanoarchaeota archaeon]|nr:PKD domain-containing protein [Nanoarchaeota archaeon]
MRFIKEIIMLVFIVFFVIPPSLALQITCDTPVISPGGKARVTVSHTDALKVGYNKVLSGEPPPQTSAVSSLWHDGSSYTFEFIPSFLEESYDIYAFAQDESAQMIFDTGSKCTVALTCTGTPNTKPSITITSLKTSLSEGEMTTINFISSDAESMKQINYCVDDSCSSFPCGYGKSCSQYLRDRVFTKSSRITATAVDMCGLSSDQASLNINVEVACDDPCDTVGEVRCLMPSGSSFVEQVPGNYSQVCENKGSCNEWSVPLKCFYGGECKPSAGGCTCKEGFTYCSPDGFCADLSSNNNNCGSCGNKCAVNHLTPQAVECVNGKCQYKETYLRYPDQLIYTCDIPYNNCDLLIENGCETSTSNDPDNCGSCGTICPEGPGTRFCLGNTCCYQSQKRETSCSDGIDNDCDGRNDCTDSDCIAGCGCTEGETRKCQKQTGVCKDSSDNCVYVGNDYHWTGCDYSKIPGYETAEKTCDGLDNDCDGQVDEGCDDDNDGYGDKSMLFKTGSAWPGGANDCDDDNPLIHPGAVESCDGIDSDCDLLDDISETTADGKKLCDCSLLGQFTEVDEVSIISPDAITSFNTGTSVFFDTTGPANANYAWKFGDGASAAGKSQQHIYTSPGTYTASVSAFMEGCAFDDSISINVGGCGSDCNGTCVNGACQPFIDDTTFSGEIMINIISPQKRKYGSKDVDLEYTISPPGVRCFYSLNKDASYSSLNSNKLGITAREGENTITLMCGDKFATVKFEVDGGTLLDDVKGKKKGNIFDFLKSKKKQKYSREQANDLLLGLIQGVDFTITKRIEEREGRYHIIINIRNIMASEAKFMFVNLSFPKGVVDSVYDIEIVQDHYVVDADPVFRFPFEHVMPEGIATIDMVIDKELTQEILDNINLTIELDSLDLLERQQATQGSLSLVREFQEFVSDAGEFTRIILRADPDKELLGFALYEKIPKCLAEHIDDIAMDPVHKHNIKILNPDPIVMWQFDKLASEQEFSYDVKGVLSKECRDQITALGIADELGLDLKKVNIMGIILPLMFIPILGLLVYFVEKFSTKKETEIKEDTQRDKVMPEKKP